MKKLNAVILIIALFLLPCGCAENETGEVSIVASESYFSDFEIKDSEVFVYCTLTVNNASKDEKTFNIVADMSEDVKNGLIAEDTVKCADKKTGLEEFSLPAGERGTFDIVIKGTSAGAERKQDRNLPRLTIVETE